jgi:hypothetical protein
MSGQQGVGRIPTRRVDVKSTRCRVNSRWRVDDGVKRTGLTPIDHHEVGTPQDDGGGW